jgi:hypothetical protein
MGFVLYDYIFVPRGALTARVYLSIPYPNPWILRFPMITHFAHHMQVVHLPPGY